jgi:hypothetical protein
MNKTNIRRVASTLLNGTLAETKGIGYNQRPTFDTGGNYIDHTGKGCGTTACIAGHAAYFAGGRRAAKASGMWRTAKKYLGISEDTALRLFAAMPTVGKEPTAKQAALVLFNLAETGQVDWSVAA